MNAMKKWVVGGWLVAAGLCGTAWAEPAAEYFAWDEAEKQLVAKTCSAYTLVTPETTTLTSGWYVVEGQVLIDRSGAGMPGLKVDGDAHLILADGAELVVTGAEQKAGIEVSVVESTVHSLAIYGQAKGTGKLTVSGGSNGGAGIGGGVMGAGGAVTVNGGAVNATGRAGAGIGGGLVGAGGAVTVNGGTVTAIALTSDGVQCGGIGRGGVPTMGMSNLPDVGTLTLNDPRGRVLVGMDTTGEHVVEVPVEEFGDSGEVIGWHTNAYVRIVPSVEYFAWNETDQRLVAQTCANYKVLNEEMAAACDYTLASGWYVVSDKVEIVQPVDENRPGLMVNGDVNLILVDDVADLRVKGSGAYAGIEVGGGEARANSLAIYGQAKGTGRLTAEGTAVDAEGAAGIGGNRNEDGGTVTIHGGTVTARGTAGAAGIGGGAADSDGSSAGAGGAVTIHGGAVTATGSDGGAGIGGGGSGGDGGTVTINGGAVTAISYPVDAGSGGLAYGDGIGGGALANLMGRDFGTLDLSGYTGKHYIYAGMDTNGVEISEVQAEGFATWHTNCYVRIMLNPPPPKHAGTADDPWPYIGVNGKPGAAYTNENNEVVFTGDKPDTNATEPWRTLEYLKPRPTKAYFPLDKVSEEEIAQYKAKGGFTETGSCVEYLTWDEVEKTLVARARTEYALVTPETETLTSGWYVVQGQVTIDRSADASPHKPGLKVDGDAHLILADGAELVVTGAERRSGITVDVRDATTNSLTIYGQANQTGRLTATGTNGSAGIGSDDDDTCGTVTINGGIVTATGGISEGGGAGIGGGSNGDGGTVTINGGVVTATGNVAGAAGIGGGALGAGGAVTINGGVVRAVSYGEYEDLAGGGGAGIGGGVMGAGGTVTINGGEITAVSYPLVYPGWGILYGDGIGAGSCDPENPQLIPFGTLDLSGCEGTYHIYAGMDTNGVDVTEVAAGDFATWYTNLYVRITTTKRQEPPEVKIVSAKSARTEGAWNGAAQVVYSLKNLDTAKTYDLAVEMLADGQFAAKTNPVVNIADGVHTQEVSRTEFFGIESQIEDPAAELTLKLIEK